MFFSYVAGMDVALIKWPSDDALRVELAALRHPRLLLVEADADPPDISDALEDWVRLPVSRQDRSARVRALESRAGGETASVPVLEPDGTLEFRGARAQLSEMQASLVRPMVDRFGAVVSRQALVAFAWPQGDTSANNLDVSIGRLRRQLHPMGLKIRTVRSRGYLLCDAATGLG
jgi:two-component system, OmpR family, response regulator